MSCFIQEYDPLSCTVIYYQNIEIPKYQTNTKKRKRYEDIEDVRTQTANVTALGVLPIPVPTPDYSPVLLESIHPHEKDDMIEFTEATHSYLVHTTVGDLSTDIISVSTLVHEFFPKFDADHVLEMMTYSKQYGKYKGMSNHAIKQLWSDNAQAASSAGTAFHFICECYCNGGLRDVIHGEQYDRIEIKQFLKFYQENIIDKGYIPFRTEMRLFTDKNTQVCGTVDLLIIRHDHPPPEECDGVLTLVDVDWKNSKKINTKAYNKQKGFGPCASLDDCNWSHYMLQQNMYKYILEKWYGTWVYKGKSYCKVKIESMILCVCHANYGDSANVIELPTCTSIIEAIFAIRQQQLCHTKSNFQQ